MAIRTKVLRRTIIILLLLWLLLLLVLYLTTGKYRELGIELLKTQLDKGLKTEIQIRRDDIHFSLFRSFPNASVKLENVLVKSAKGPDYSEFRFTGKDTLLYAGKADLVLDLWSLLTKKYVLKQIRIKDGIINLLSDSKELVNYDVWIDSDPNDTLSDQVEYKINTIELENMEINYLDTKIKLKCKGKINKAEISGSFRDEDFQFHLKALTVQNTVNYEKLQLKHPGMLTSDIDIKKEGDNYKLRNGEFEVYGLPVSLAVDYNITSRKYAVTCHVKSAALQRLDKSLIKRYAGDFQFYPAKGQISLDAEINGSSRERNSITINTRIDKGVFINKKEDIKIENTFLSAKFTNGKLRNNRSSTLEIDTLRLTSGDSRISVSGIIKNFDSPQISGSMEGFIELKKLMFIKNISEKFILDGTATIKAEMDGQFKSYKNIQPQDLKGMKIKGFVKMDKIVVEKPDQSIPKIGISGVINLKNLMEIGLEEIDIITGKSDLKVNGTISNIPQFSPDKSFFPIFRGTIHSNKFHVEDFLIGDEEDKDKEPHVALPDSVYLSGNFILDNFYFDKFYATEVEGSFQYRPKKLIINGFNMNSQGGRIESHQLIEQKGDKIYTQTLAEFRNLDISDLFIAFNEFDLDIITHSNIDGTLSGNAEVTIAWDPALNPIYDEIAGHSVISIEKGELIDYKPMLGLSRFIELDELKHIKFDRMQMDMHIKDQNLNIAKTYIKSSIFAMYGSGDHSFDNEYTYRIELQLAEVLWKKAKKHKTENTEFGYVVDDGLGRTIIPLIITGKDTVFNVEYDRKAARSTLMQKLKLEKDSWKNDKGGDNQKYKDDDLRLDWHDEESQLKKEEREEIKKTIPDDNEDEDFTIQWEGD
jgi:hypothetical protein